MNEEALQDAYKLFAAQGYNGDINQFIDLISANSEALQDAHKIFSAQGYNGDINQFKTLIGVGQQPVTQKPVAQTTQPVMQLPLKKKEGSTSPSGIGTLESSGIKLTNVRKALGQEEEQKPIMMQPVRTETPAEAEVTWRRKPKSAFMPDYTQPIEQEKNLVERPAELGFIGRYTPERDKEKVPQFVEKTLDALTPYTFSSLGTEPSKKALEYYLKDMGFTVEDSDKSSSYTGKYVNVVAPNGNKHLLYLGNEIMRTETYGFAGLPSEDDIEGLKNFIRYASVSDSSIAKKEYLYEKENQRFKTKESIENEVKEISTQAQVFQDNYKKMLTLQKDIEDIQKDLKRWEDFGEQNTPKYIQTQAYLTERQKELEEYKGTLIENESTLKTQSQQLDKAMGKYFEFQSTQGSFGGTLYRSIAESSVNIFSNFIRSATGKTIDSLPMGSLMDENTYRETYTRKAKARGIDVNEPMDAIEFTKIDKEINAEIRDEFKKAAITGKAGGEKLQNVLTIQGVRESLKEFVTSAPIMGTKEYKEKREKEGNFVERGVIGLAGSLPAMVGGKYIRLANMFMMTTDAVLQEMDNDPDFENVSENEKQLIAAPIGVIGAALEEIGLRSLLKGSSVTTSIVKSILGRVPANASASALRKATFDTVKEMGLRGTLAIAGATLAEAETGGAQQINEYFVKDTYNMLKGKKMFDNPEFLSSQYFYDIYDAARTEAVGGFVMGVPNSIAAAFKKDGFRGLDDETFKIFEQLAKDNDSRKFFVTDLKNKINSGQITGAQGKEIINAYDQAAGMIGTVDDEITDIESRKIAMDLISERKKLEAKRDKMDPGLAKPIQKRIDQINEQLSQITQDAIQKQAASQVSLQPEAGAGQEVEVGGPEAKPKITPEESKRKEDLVAALSQPENDKGTITIDGAIIDRKEAQAELDAIAQKEQAVPAEQGGAEQGVLSPEEEKLRDNRRVDLFPEESEFADVIGGSGRNSSLSNYSEVNGVGVASYTNPDNGLVDVIMSGTSDNDYVGYVRVYENGKPTNRWTSKMSNESGNKDNFKTMISEVQSRLPENHEYTESTNISIDGVRVYSNQLNRGYEVLTDANGNPVTNTVTLNAASVEGLQQAATQEEKQSLYDNMTVTTREQFNALRDKITALMPNARVLWNQANNTVQIQLPVLVQSKKATTVEQTPAQKTFEQRKSEIEKITDPEQRKVAEIEFIMSNLASGVGEASANKIREYADRIISGKETRNQVIQGLPKSFVDGIDQLLAAQQAPATTETTTTEVTPVEQQFTEQDRARKAELEEAMRKADKRRKNITVGETTMLKAEAKAELAALNQKEQAAQQPVTPTVTPTAIAPVETLTPEQEADKLEQMMLAKMGAPKVEAAPVTETPMAEEKVEEEAKLEIPKAEEVADIELEIKDVEVTPEEIQKEVDDFNEESLLEQEKPKAGQVAELSIDEINADPERFQYKEVTDKEAGVTEKFKGEKAPFKKELAGVISVWVDPADGKTYVINGHHRLDFAKRSGEKTMNVIYIDAKNASEARLKGAMQNIAEGMGTDMDAAKVFRETGMTVEQVQASGISVKGAKAMNGLALASLSDNLFNLVVQGKLSQTVGIIIGSTIKNQAVQEQFYNVIKGKNLNNGTIKVMAEDIQAAPTENVEQMDLFGVTATEQASYQQRASFIAGIRAIVSKAKNILGKAAKSKGFLEEYGNDIDEIASETGSRESAMALAVFDRLRNTSPEIRALIDKGVERIKNGENKNKVLNETAKQIIEATPRILEGVTGQPVAGRGEVKEPGTKGKQGATGKKLADAVRKNLKIKGPDGLQSNILGILPAIWNAGVETMATAIEAGVAVTEAVQKAIEYIKEKHGKKFNEAAAEKKLLIGHYKGAIEIAREAKVTNEGLKTYFKRQGLTDAQIETLLKVKEKAEKKPISKEKVIGKPKPKKVTVNEMTALKDQIRLEAKAAREGAKSVSDAVKAITEYFNSIKDRGNLTRKDIIKILGIISKVNSQKTLDNAANKIFEIIEKAKSDVIEVSEYKALKDQLRLEAKAAREAKGDLNTKRKMLTAAIKEMQKKGKITVRQAKTLINRVNAVNLDNPVMVDRLLDYAEKVFSNAEYAEKIAVANKSLKKAKENVRTKIGVSEGLTTLMTKLFNINPNLIPDDVLEAYLELVDMMSKRQAVLTLKESAELTKDVEKILDAIDNELSALDELIDIFDNYNDKVLDDNGKIDYAATIDKMLEAGVITASDAKLYKKYKDKVLPKEAREKKSEEQLAEEKKDLIDAIGQTQVDENKLGMREERDAVRRLIDAMTPENLAKLTNAELKNLLKVLDNINNGFMPHYAVLMTQKLNAAGRSATLGKAIANAGKLPITKLLANIKSLFPGAKSANMIMVINSPKYAIDQIFGYFKSTPIYDSVFKPIVQAFSSYKTDARKVKEKLDKAFNKVARSYMNNPAKIKMSQFKMMAYALQLEYNSNKDKGEGFYSAADYINETIKHARGDQSTMSKKDVEFLDKILKVYGTRDADGNIDIDIDKLYNSFNNAEKQAIKAIQEVNMSIRDKAMFTAAVVRGDKMKPIDNYIHHNVLPTGVTDTDLRSVTQDMNARMMPSTRAKVLKERTKGAKPLNFNIFNATQKAANEVLMDFHLTEAVRTSRMVLNNTRKELQERGNEKQLNAFNAVAQSFETTLDNTLTNTFNDSSFVDSVVALVTKQAYRTLLAGASRWTAELMSNLSYVTFVNPIAYKNGITKYRKFVMSEKGPAILRNIGSAVQDRIYESSVLSGRMIDGSIMDEAIGLDGTTSNYMVVNAMQTIYNNTLKKGQNFVAATADALISTPDKMALRPFWFGIFAQNFKKETGQDVDYEKLAANDEAYLSKFKNAINKSKDVADSQAMLAGGTKNPFAARQKSMSVKGASALAQMYQSFNNFLNSFIINEYIAARTGVYAMMGNGKINRRQGAAMLAGVTTRTTLYTLLVKELGRGLAWLFLGDDDEEEEEKSITEKAGQAFAGSMTSLILGRDFGNMTRSMINYGVEKVNENYIQDMMDGKYTKEDVIAFNSLIPSSLNGRPQFSDLMINMTGPAQPIVRSLKNLYENSFAAEAKGEDTIKKRENYWKYTLPLEAAGHLGFVPLYKDVRTITNKALQGEVNAIKEVKEEEKAGKAEAYGGYKTIEEFEEKDPIKYDEYSAKGGKLYKYREDERKEDEEKNKDKPFRGLSEEKFKEYYPKEWAKNYGPGTAYFRRQNSPAMLQKKAQEKMREAQLEQKRKIAAAKREQQEALKKALGK